MSATVSTILRSVGREGLLDRLVLGDGLDDRSILSAREGLLDRLVLGDGLVDRVDPVGREGLLDRLVLGDGLDDLVDLGRSELLADLGERRGEGVVDPALGLLDRVRQRVARAPGAVGVRARGSAVAGAAHRRAPASATGRAGGSSACLRLSPRRWRSESSVMILSLSAWPSWTTSPGWATRWWDSSLMWIRPSRPVADPDEGAEVDELGDRAVDDVADLEVRDRGVPRVGLEAADRQADPAALVVDVDDLGLDLVADLVAGLGVVDLVPRELALVDEAVDAAEVDEDAERRDRADAAGDLLADLQAAEQLVALLAALLVEGDLLRQDQAVGLAVDLEDLEPELAADERLELLGDLLGGVARLLVLRAAREVDDLADRHEAADAAVDDEAALVVVDDRRLDDRRPPRTAPASRATCARGRRGGARGPTWPSGDSGWRT